MELQSIKGGLVWAKVFYLQDIEKIGGIPVLKINFIVLSRSSFQMTVIFFIRGHVDTLMPCVKKLFAIKKQIPIYKAYQSRLSI